MLEESHMLGHDPALENELVVFLYKCFGDAVSGRIRLPAEAAWHRLSRQELGHFSWRLFAALKGSYSF